MSAHAIDIRLKEKGRKEGKKRVNMEKKRKLGEEREEDCIFFKSAHKSGTF